MSRLDGHRRIVVVRALPGLGDQLCAVPALRSLRAGAPDAHITLLGLPGANWLVERFPHLVDESLELPHWPSIPEATGTREGTLELLVHHAGTFDLVLQMQGSGGAINVLAALLSSSVVTAYVHRDERIVLTRTTLMPVTRPWPGNGHEIERLLALVRSLGAPDTGTALEFPVRAADHIALERWLADAQVTISRPVGVVHPGASRADRRWSARGFAAVARHLNELGLTVLVTGTTEERSAVEEVVATAPGAHAMLDAPLGALAALLSTASALVANDTGVAHLGVAVGTPTLVVGTTSDLTRWAPLDRRRNAVVNARGRLALDVALVNAEADRLVARGAP